MTLFIVPGKQKPLNQRNITSYSNESLLERLRKKCLQDYSFFNHIDPVFTDLTTAIQDIANKIAPMKYIWVKGNALIMVMI